MNSKVGSNQSLLSSSILFCAIFITIISGIIWQGGELFWFGPAGACTAALLLYLIHKNYRKPVTLPASAINRLLILFAAWCLLTVLWSDVPAISIIRALTVVSAVAGLYCYFFITSSSLPWKQLWNVVIAAGLVLFIYSCIELYIGISTPNSLFFNKNTHAAYRNRIILPTIAYFLISTKPTYKFFLGAALFALAFSHALPGSRGATLGQFIGVGMILLVASKHVGRKVLAQFAVIYTAALSLATLLTSNLFRFFEFKVQDADLGRREIWEGAIDLLKDTPWYGNGVGTYWLLHPAYRHINDPSSGQNAHNDYLQYWIEAGIPGLALLLLLMLAIAYYWWAFITNTDNNTTKKIEVTGLAGALVAIGSHAFLTFNLGLFSILFLCGLLLGRFIHLTGDTKNIRFMQNIPIRKGIFSLSISGLAIIFVLYFSILSSFSHLYNRAADYYAAGNISAADKLNSIALGIYPFDDRPYLLYVQIYQTLLNEINDAGEKQKLYDRSIEYLAQARRINPHIAQTYYLHAKLIELNPELYGADWEQEVIRLYQKSLKTDPLHIYSSRRLASFYLLQGEPEKASDTVYNAVKYYLPPTKDTLKHYAFAEQILLASGHSDHLTFLLEKKDGLIQYLKQLQNVHHEGNRPG